MRASLHNNRHPDLKTDFTPAHPPFNISDWGGERLRGDRRWQYCAPPAGNANFAWPHYIVHHLPPSGVAGVVLAKGSMSSNQSGEGEICKKSEFRDRRGHVLFIDARKLGRMVDRTHRELTDEHIARIVATHHAWRGEKDTGDYADVPSFCRSAAVDAVRKHGPMLTPGRHVGAEAQVDDGEPFEEKMRRLAATFDAAVAASFKALGYGA